MKFDGNLEDLKINRNVLALDNLVSLPESLVKYYAGSEVRVNAKLPLTNTTYLTNGSAINTTILQVSNSEAPYSMWIIRDIYAAISGNFLGGSGSIDVSVGYNSPAYADLLVANTITVGDANSFWGNLITARGGSMKLGGAWNQGGFSVASPSTVNVRIDATGHSGTVTSGLLTVALFMTPIVGLP